MKVGAKKPVTIRGFYRIQLTDRDSGKVVGDSGWKENTVVNQGFQDYICKSVGKLAGSKQVSYMAIGTGVAPSATDTSLSGETGVRVTVSASVISSKTLQATAQFAGTDMGGTCTIQNVALADVSSSGTILCGTTYATSQWASNQNVKNWRSIVATLLGKLREFGGHLFETIPSRASKAINAFVEGVTTMHEALAVAR